jgi:hypothetical protein
MQTARKRCDADEPEAQAAPTQLTIDTATLRRLSVLADVDPRTIRVEVEAARGCGRHARGMAGARARRVLAAEGYFPPFTSEAVRR